jgi:hypothetical protein
MDAVCMPYYAAVLDSDQAQILRPNEIHQEEKVLENYLLFTSNAITHEWLSTKDNNTIVINIRNGFNRLWQLGG